MTNAAASVPTERVIRVFVSSTFADMQEEREELVKRIFPQLRKLCEDRGVVWGEVDLRWGINDEQKSEGKVLPICLDEIRNCRPYFIGILGQRYGWVPTEIDPDLVAREPWLAEHRDHSVTELEILHGVLRDPAQAGRALFYFRDPAYVEKLPAAKREEFRDAPGSASAAKLIALKQRIRDSKLVLRPSNETPSDRSMGGPPMRADQAPHIPLLEALKENYTDPKQLGEWILADFKKIIDDQFPIKDIPEPLDREAAEHEATARRLALVYIGRDEYFKRLDDHANGEGPPLVVLGESGGGKSALLANWALHYRKAHRDAQLILHFIGASPYSADWQQMLRRVMGELKRRFAIPDDMPTSPDALRDAFPLWLAMAAAREGSRCIIVLDALNQLADRDAAPDLGWLPKFIPANIRLIVSTLPGRPFDALEKRGWLAPPATPLKVAPMTVEERKKLIVDYLKPYVKTPTDDQIKRIATDAQTANPLYLKAILEEIRVFGSHEKLDARIDHYLKTKTIPELYRRILKRYEEDYERDRPGLVRDAMRHLWAARRGLTEAELLDLLGTNKPSNESADPVIARSEATKQSHQSETPTREITPLPQAHWSPLSLAANQAIVNRAGFLNLGHDYLREAVQQEYLPTENDQRQAHLALADYFETRELNPRKADELPWQLAQAGPAFHERLKDCVTDIDTFMYLFQESHKSDLRRYWLQLGDGYDVAVEYLAAVKHFETHYPNHSDLAKRQNSVAMFLYEMARHEAAEPLFKAALEMDSVTFGSNHPRVASLLNNLAELLTATNRRLEAESLYRRALAIEEETFGPNHPDVAHQLSNLAVLLHSINKLPEAECLYRRALTIYFSSYGTNHPHVARALSNLAGLLGATNRYAEAEPLIRQAVSIDESAFGPNHPNVAIRLNNLGDLLIATNRRNEAEPILRRALEILENSFGNSHPNVATGLNSLAEVLRTTNRHSEAEPLFRRALAIEEASLGTDHPYVAIRLNNLAQLLVETGRRSEAEPLFRRALMIEEASFGSDHPNVAIKLNNLAELFRNSGQYAEAEPLIRRALGVFEESFGPTHPHVAVALNNLGLLLRATNRDLEAAAIFRRVIENLLEFTRLTGREHPHLRHALGNFSGVLRGTGRDDSQIHIELNEILARYGMSLSS